MFHAREPVESRYFRPPVAKPVTPPAPTIEELQAALLEARAIIGRQQVHYDEALQKAVAICRECKQEDLAHAIGRLRETYGTRVDGKLTAMPSKTAKPAGHYLTLIRLALEQADGRRLIAGQLRTQVCGVGHASTGYFQALRVLEIAGEIRRIGHGRARIYERAA